MDIAAPLYIKDDSGFGRRGEPVRTGVPLPKGIVTDESTLSLLNATGEIVPLQAVPLCRWSDGSLKWVLLDFLADVEASSTASYLLKNEGSTDRPVAFAGIPPAKESGFSVATGRSVFSYQPNESTIFIASQTGEAARVEYRCRLRLTTSDKKVVPLAVERVEAGVPGPVRTRATLRGELHLGGKKFLRVVARIDHFAASGLCRLEIEIHNPSSALHPAGIWDLGDPGSVKFAECALVVSGIDEPATLDWAPVPGGARRRCEAADWCLYQDSSGGEHWDSPNHVDAAGNLTVSFPGYRAFSGAGATESTLDSGGRATPWVQVATGSGWMAAGVEKFWQNFPKALQMEQGELTVALFPRQCAGGFELQGGERKRHVVWFQFGQNGDELKLPDMLRPLTVTLDPAWVERTKSVPCFVAEDNEKEELYLRYVKNVIEGPNSFFAKREAIDEFGWRNFGDLYADHEAVFHSGPELYPSHYNNQYDFVYGSMIHFLRSGDQRWHELMQDLARHVADIDVYHTCEDRAAYNGGMFWHTYHYQPAGRGTHRGFTGIAIPERHRSSYGGGPSNEQDYSSGLLYYHCLTGDPWAGEVVVGLAEWVIAMDDGSKTILSIFDDGPTGLASQTGSTEYHNPGRGAGNSINTLMDAYALTRDRKYFAKAEELIKRCIHPNDDLPSLRLDEPEIRWFYLVFLQVLGKYLDVKVEMGEFDFAFFYARESLLHYSKWAYSNEAPYKEQLDKVEYPTETWSAQDIRKACVLNCVARYAESPADRDRYKQKARMFYDRCLADLLSFDTAFLTRPLVLLTVYGTQQAYYEKCALAMPPRQGHAHDFGQPAGFLNQRKRLKDTVKHKLKVLILELSRLLKVRLYQGFSWLSRF